MTTKSVPTPDEIWGILRESGEQIKAMSAETAASSKKTDKLIRELRISQKELRISQKELRISQKETARQMKETDRQIQKIGAGFNRRWGALVESLVEGKLVKILQARGIDIMRTHSRSETQWKKPDGTLEKREFDIIAANGTEVVAVEVKTTLTQKDVKFFMETLGNFKNYFPRYLSETVFGAVAYLKSENEAHVFAEKQGLFIIKATGDSASIVNAVDFKPKTFA